MALVPLLLAAAVGAEPGPPPAGEAQTPPAPAARTETAPASPEEQYQQRFISAEDYPVVRGTHGTVTTSIEPFFFQGKYRRPIAGAELYDAIGRGDLGAAYRSRMTQRYALGGVGLAAALGGTIYALAGSASVRDPDVNLPMDEFARQSQAAGDARTRAMVTGAIVSASGVVLFAIGAAIDPNPVDAVELRRLVDQYDERLRRELRLGASGESAPTMGRARLAFGVAPVSGGAVAGLGGTF